MDIVYIVLLIIIVIIGLKTCLFLYEKDRKIKTEDEYKEEVKNAIEKYNNQQVQQENQVQKQIQIYPYHAVQLLTRNEYYYFLEMKKIIDPIGLQILAKVRLADLIEVDKGLNYADFNRYFAKIKSKHVDFVIVDNMKVVLVVELDDSSHQNQERQERDNFVNNALTRSGYIVVRTFGSLAPLIQALSDKGYRPNLYTSEK